MVAARLMHPSQSNVRLLASAMTLSLAFLIALATAPAARAENVTPPDWDVYEICAGKKLDGTCARVESDARRALLDKWRVVPAADRTACTAEITSSGTHSYRALSTCINTRAFEAFDSGSAS